MLKNNWRSVAVSTGAWVGVLWGVCALWLSYGNLKGHSLAEQIKPGARFVVALRMDGEAQWRSAEWPYWGKEPLIPLNAALLPEQSGTVERGGARVTITPSPDQTAPEMTVAEGRLIEERFRYRVEAGGVKALAYEAASTLLRLLSWGAALLILAAGITAWLAKRQAGSDHSTGWAELLAPATWRRDFRGTPEALYGALAAGGFFANKRLGLPPGVAPNGARATVKLVRLRATTKRGWADLLPWLLVGLATLAIFAPPGNSLGGLVAGGLLLAGLLAGIIRLAKGFRRSGGEGAAPPHWRVIVSVWRAPQAAWAFQIGLGVFPAAVIWTLGSAWQLASGSLAPHTVQLEAACSGATALVAYALMVWGVRRTQKLADVTQSAAQALAAIPEPDEKRLEKPMPPVSVAEVVIAVAIVAGMLFVVPHYGNYLPTSRVHESIVSSEKITKPLSDFHRKHGRWPTTWAELEPPLGAPVTIGQAVKVYPGRDGSVELRYPPDFSVPELQNEFLLLTPLGDPVKSAIVWNSCAGLGLPVKYRPGQCRLNPANRGRRV